MGDADRGKERLMRWVHGETEECCLEPNEGKEESRKIVGAVGLSVSVEN